MKRLVALAFALIVLCTASVVPAFAAEEPEVVGYSSERVEKIDLTAVVNFKNYETYPDLKRYKITDPEGLVAFSDYINTNKEWNTLNGITIYLANDIDMTGVEMDPIGNDTMDGTINSVNSSPGNFFEGTFDGQGHVIDHLVMNSTSNNIFVVVGLFGNNINMTVKNLIIGENCSFSWTGTSTEAGRHPMVGALCARLQNGKIENCWNMADAKGGRMSSGIAARINGRFEISNCTNSGDMEALQCAGGIAGYVDNGSGSYVNCRNTGNVSVIGEGIGDSGGRAAGGIVSRQRCEATIDNCINNGTIQGVYYAGGIAGGVERNYEIKNCTNFGSFSINLPADPAVQGAASYLVGNLVQQSTQFGNNDKTGQDDPSCVLETITFDPTPVPGTEAEATETTVADTTVEEATTEPEPIESDTDAETTESDLSTTKAPDPTDKAPEENKDGCSSSVLGGISLIVIAAGAAIAMTKKKED